jgi:putative thioredoxin
MDVGISNFQQEVIDSSATQPVVVDFWAPWCAPCRALTPVLEKLEREYAGRFKLAKVNVDENQELAEVLQVRSIPAVFAFRDGKPLGNFLGALPESQVRAFIERALPSPFIEVMDRAERLIQEGRVDAAEKLLAEVPSNIDWDTRLEALRAAVSFARSGANEDKLKAKLAANPDDHEARLKLAQLYAGARRYREAMDQLLQIAQRDKNWRDGEARRQLLTLFTLAAGEPELVSEYRRKLASALY